MCMVDLLELFCSNELPAAAQRRVYVSVQKLLVDKTK